MEKLDINEFRELTTEEIRMVSGAASSIKYVVKTGGCGDEVVVNIPD